MFRIKKDDVVMILAGRDKGKTGKVLRIFPQDHKALVENINMIKKAQRRTQQNQQGGFVDRESPIHLSNIMLLDKKTNQSSRFKVNVLKDGSKVRLSKKSSEVI